MYFFSQISHPLYQQKECRACGNSELSLYVTASTSGLGAASDQCSTRFYLCRDCLSINEFSSDQGFYNTDEDTSFANFYLDVGAGIEEMIDPIARFSAAPHLGETHEDCFTFLEIGCGFGFVVDYASSVLGWRSNGIEPGGYGRIGAQALGIKVGQRLLGEGSESDKEEYDCIYASEVIEHVADPVSLLRICNDRLSDSGVLIMTTPSAEYINDQNPPEEVYACLFPGEHKVIFSAKGLENALTRAGFSYFSIERRRESNWVIIASRRQEIQSIYGDPALRERSRSQYREYLYKVLKRKDNPEFPQQHRVKMAICFRLVKFLVNNGSYNEALSTLRKWYSDIALLADPELKFAEEVLKAPVEDENLICSLLSLCLIGLTRERVEVELYQRSYPRSGAAFLKTLGFFVTIIAHNLKSANTLRVLNHVLCFQKSLIDYAIYAKNSDKAFYHLELISLIGPATSSLFLAKKKLGAHISIREADYVSQDWFSSSYPVSYDEILSLCSRTAQPIGNSATRRYLAKAKELIRSITRKTGKKIVFLQCRKSD